MIAHGKIINGKIVDREYKEVVGLFDSYVADQAKVWDNLVPILEPTYAWTYMKTFKKNNDGRTDF